MKTKIYLDNCCYNRPFDDQTSIRINLESQAKLEIQDQIKQGMYDLTWSYIQDYETSQNPYDDRRTAIMPWRKIAKSNVNEETEEIIQTAEALNAIGIKKYDALHIACAIADGCEYFITTDKKLLNKASSIDNIAVVNPLTFVMDRERENED